MDPLDDKYLVFSKNPGEIVRIGPLELKYDSSSPRGKNYIRLYVREVGKTTKTDWISADVYVYARRSPFDRFYGKAYGIRNNSPFNALIGRYYGVIPGNEKDKRERLFQEFEAALNEDYKKWLKLRRQLKKNILKKEADEKGVSLQELFNKKQYHNKAVSTIETTNLKMEILKALSDQKRIIEEACEAIENNTFNQQMASELRRMGKTFGTSDGGIFPKMRKCASLIRQTKKGKH